MKDLKIGIQYIITLGSLYIFDGVYEGNIREQIYRFNGGPCCSLRLTADEVSRCTFTPDPIEAKLATP